jgi:hypothetical protein
MHKIEESLKVAGATWDDVVFIRRFTVDMNKYLATVYDPSIPHHWKGRPPPSTLIEVSALSEPCQLMETDVFAVVHDKHLGRSRRGRSEGHRIADRCIGAVDHGALVLEQDVHPPVFRAYSSCVIERRRALSRIISVRSSAGRISKAPAFTPGCFDIKWPFFRSMSS